MAIITPISRAIAVFTLVLSVALGQDSGPPNCDPLEGAVDLERCPNVLEEVMRPHLKAQYCMSGPCCTYTKEFCSKSTSDYVISRTRVVHGVRGFCERLLRDQYEYVNLSVPHSVTQEEGRQYLSSIGGDGGDIDSFAAYVDINNDGAPEWISWGRSYSGRGCDIEVYFEIDSAKEHIRKSALSRLLSRHSCRNYYRAFKYRGKIYLENRRFVPFPGEYLDLVREVTLLTGSTSQSVCTFAFKE